MKNVLFLAMLFALSCSSSEKKESSDKRETLLIYSPHGKELLDEFEKIYEDIYPEVDIQSLEMSSQEIFERISAESNNPQADIWWGAPSSTFMRAEKLQLLETYRPSWAANVPTYARSKNDFWYGTFSTPEVIAFNENTVNINEAPKDWNEVVNPKWKNKIVLREPMAAGTLRAIFCGMLEQSIKKTGSEDAGWAWLKALDANVNEYTANPSQMHTKVGSNTQAITLWNMPDIVLQKNKGYPFGYLFPIGGTVVLTDGIAIVKGTKKRELAERFYEFVTSEQSMILQAVKFHRIPARSDISKEVLPDWQKGLNFTALDIDWELVANKEQEWMRKWKSEIQSK